MPCRRDTQARRPDCGIREWLHPLRICEIGAELRPVRAAIGRGHEKLKSREQLVLIPRGEHDRLRERRAQVQVGVDGGAHADPLLRRITHAHEPAGISARVYKIRVERIWDNRAPLPRRHCAPVECGDLAEVSTAARADRARVLLRGVDPVRKRIVGGDVVDLLGGLVVPRSPMSCRRRASRRRPGVEDPRRMRSLLVGSSHICCGSSPPGAPLNPVKVLPPSVDT